MANREKLNCHQYRTKGRTKGNLCFGNLDVGTLKSLTTGQHCRWTICFTIRITEQNNCGTIGLFSLQKSRRIEDEGRGRVQTPTRYLLARQAAQPPSTGNATPVINAAPGEQR